MPTKKKRSAGRPWNVPDHLLKVPLGLKLPRWLIDWLDTRPQSRAVVIEESLKKQYKLKPPL